MPARNCNKDYRCAAHQRWRRSVVNANNLEQVPAVMATCSDAGNERAREVGRTLRTIARWRYGSRMVVGLGFALAAAGDHQLLEQAMRWLKALVP